MKLYLQLNEPGSGEIKVPMADSIASQIAIGKYIRVAYRGEFRGGFFVENIQQTPAESGDRGGQWLTANGRGPLALLDDAIIWYSAQGQSSRRFENQSAASILLTLISEAKARGCFPNLVVDFDATHDSADQTWADSNTLNLRVGTSLLDLVRQIAGLGFDFKIDVNWVANQFVLQMFKNAVGNDLHLKTVFDVGNNAKQLRQDSIGSEIKNALLIEVSGSVFDVITDSGSVTAYRRRESHFSAQQAETTAQGQILASPELALSKNPSVEIALSVIDAAEYPRAFIDYNLGDWVGVRWQENTAPVSYRIRGMQLDWEESGYANITLELNSVRKETEIRLAQALKKITGGSGSSATSAPADQVLLLSQHDSNPNAHPNRIDDAEKIRGKDVSTTPPSANQVLVFDGSQWKPANAPTGGHTIQDEGVSLTQRSKLNFVGAGVAATDDAVNNATVVTIPSDGHTIQDEGTPLTQRSKLNFVGAGVTATDDAVNDATVVTISGVTVALESTILASTPVSGQVAYATDTQSLYVGDGTNWNKVPFALVPESANPDMGVVQNSSRIGYGVDYITDKTLNNTVIGSNGNPTSGGVRVTTAGVFQIYLNGTWNTVVTNFVLREDPTFGYTFEHMPIGFTNYIEIMTGQSLGNLGLNGLPITNAYQTSMGAYPVPAMVGGRTI